MGEKTDTISGRIKQAVGAVIGNAKTKREGERQEKKGELKGKVDTALGEVQDARQDLRDNAKKK